MMQGTCGLPSRFDAGRWKSDVRCSPSSFFCEAPASFAPFASLRLCVDPLGHPESGQSVLVLCNLDSPSASRMGDWLDARMPLK
jgi:hypothetical protein